MQHSSKTSIAVASGKGGTGKTMVATNIAALLTESRLIDCDVEEPNAHIFLEPQIQSQSKVFIEVPEVDAAVCDGCGECAKACRFQALACAAGRLIVFPELCHSCDVCYTVCPKDALKPALHELGEIRTGTFGDGSPFADALLKIGQVRSAEVIDRLVGLPADDRITVRDCPPGTSCAMVAAVRGSSVGVLVTEPTPFGLHDLRAAVETLEWLGIPHCVVINRCDLGSGDTEEFCREKGIPVVGRIPFTREIARIMSVGKLLVDEDETYRRMFGDISQGILSGEMRTVKRDTPIRSGGETTVHDLFGRCKDRTLAKGIKNVAVISGKGGTGKTTLTASFAVLLKDKVSADCDVDAANLHLLLHHELLSSGYFRSSYIAEIDPDKCSGCGVCARACRFDAITMAPKAVVDPLKCEGCGLCKIVCPLAEFEDENPVTIRQNVDGELFHSTTPHGDLLHATLYPGGEASGKLVTLLRGTAENLAIDKGLGTILIDAPPGIGCPVNASITQVDVALIVTEPSMSAVHDLKRVLKLTQFFGIDSRVIVNRADLNAEIVTNIEELCARENVRIIGSIPFDRNIVDALAQGLPPVLYDRCKTRDTIVKVFETVFGELKGAEYAKR
ncbi:MAG: 4Fe-4S binding protein [Planctomycetes bacterium]|nr:4Fe-4S binding protein [Planctomycetota bacterium]